MGKDSFFIGFDRHRAEETVEQVSFGKSIIRRKRSILHSGWIRCVAVQFSEKGEGIVCGVGSYIAQRYSLIHFDQSRKIIR